MQTLAVEESGRGRMPASNLAVGYATHASYPPHAVPNLMLSNHDLVRFGDLVERAGFGGPDTEQYVASLMEARGRHPALWNGAWQNLVADETLFVDLKVDGRDRVLYLSTQYRNRLSAGRVPADRAWRSAIFRRRLAGADRGDRRFPRHRRGRSERALRDFLGLMVQDMDHPLRPTALVAFLSALALGACTTPAWQVSAGDSGDAEPVPSALAHYLESRASAPVEDPAAAYRPWVALVPIHEDSGFRRGVFDLPFDLPRMLAPMLAARDVCRVVPPAAVETAVTGRDHRWVEEHLQALADTLQADYLVTGTLHVYRFERLHVGDPMLAGYKSYGGTVEMSAALHGTSPLGAVGSVKIRKESKDRGLGLDLLGKPRKGDEQFINLDRMTFGGDEFRATALGEATVLTLQQLALELDRMLEPRELSDVEDEPRILSVFGDEIFINLGHAHGIQKGYRLSVLGGPRADVPVVEVHDVISDNVSRVVALRGADRIAPGQTLELIGAEADRGE